MAAIVKFVGDFQLKSLSFDPYPPSTIKKYLNGFARITKMTLAAFQNPNFRKNPDFYGALV